MANPEHIKILNKGVSVWNDWRAKNPEVIPDLTGARLKGASLDSANLSKTNLAGAKLDHARCFDTDLSYTDLRGVDCLACEFVRSNLRHAKLNEADIIWTIFSEADLSYADFEGARFGKTIMGSVNLSTVKGLDSCSHSGPSIIDHQTLVISGSLPINFLRGIGLSDTYIEYLPSLRNDPIQFYSCFISYSSKDQRFADRLYADLQNKGVRCWFAPEDLKIGDKTRVRIDESIKVFEKLLLILSKQSVASDWVQQEVETALDRERKEKRTILFPIRLDDTVMKIDTGWPALIKNTRNIGDFRKWRNTDAYQKAFDRLLRDLKAGE